MRIALAAIVAAVSLTACGAQQQCGPGTVELRDGTCMGTNQQQSEVDDDFDEEFDD